MDVFSKNVRIYNIPYGKPEWYKFRSNGIGGSELLNLTSYTDYSNPARMYSEKVGLMPIQEYDNEAMFHGRYDEAKVADLWQYFDKEEYGYIKNYNEGNKLRTCYPVVGFAVNKKYPWLFASVDRIIPAGNFKLLDGSILEQHGILECKTISGFASDKWEYEIPPYYIYQVHQYMLIYEVDYAEIAVIKDGRHLMVYPVERSEVIIEEILSMTYDFWYNRVIPAKKALMDYEQEFKEKGTKNEKYLALIDNLEPEPVPGKSYYDFLSEKYKREVIEVEGDAEVFDFGIMDIRLKDVINKLNKEKSYIRNKILKKIVDNRCEKITFGLDGHLKYMQNKSGTYNLYNRIRYSTPVDEVNELTEKLIESLTKI